MAEKPTVVILKSSSDMAKHIADGYGELESSINFYPTIFEDKAIEMILDGSASLVVTGLFGIEWERILEKLPPNTVLITSVSLDSMTIATIQRKNVRFMEQHADNVDAILSAIREMVGIRS